MSGADGRKKLLNSETQFNFLSKREEDCFLSYLTLPSVAVIPTFNGNGRIALLVKRNGAYRRFVERIEAEWKYTRFRLHRESGHYVIIAGLRKKVKQNYQAVVRINVNSGSFAITVLSGRKVMKQLYLDKIYGESEPKLCRQGEPQGSASLAENQAW